ncbi:transposable element Tcb1 transposase [Trichonephila clavipes]|nr:transposable element Tcb1 transposase [Trichonephila clavipes]
MNLIWRSPSSRHWYAAKTVLAYLYSTGNPGLFRRLEAITCVDRLARFRSDHLLGNEYSLLWLISFYLSSRKIGSCVGRNLTTVVRICDRWMQEDTTDRRGQSHPPQCTISREDKQIGRMTVTDRSVTSGTVAQHIESVTDHSVSTRTIRRRLQQS